MRRRPGQQSCAAPMPHRTRRSLREFGQFAFQGRDVAFLAGNSGLQLGDSILILLIVALFAATLGFAAVVFLLQCRQTFGFSAQFGFEDATCIAVA